MRRWRCASRVSTAAGAARRWNSGGETTLPCGPGPSVSPTRRWCPKLPDHRAAAASPDQRGQAERLRGSPWQRLYFLPDPHGHGSLRATRLTSASPPAEPAAEPPAEPAAEPPAVWTTPPSPSTV